MLVELFARAVFLIPALSGRVAVPDQLGWRRKWVAQHAADRSANPYGFDRYDASTGWRPKSNIRNMRVFGDKLLNTNQEGFRGTRDFSLRRDTTKTRILLLGDSFTFGEDVSDDETYAHHLGQLLPNVEILNLGVHGYGHDQMLVLLTELGTRYNPDVVLLGFVAADMSRNALAFRDYAKPWFTIDHDTLVRRGSPVPTPAESLRWDWARPRTIDLLLAILARTKSPAARRAEEETITSALLADIVRVALSVGSQPVFAYLPDSREIAAAATVPQAEQWLQVECIRMQQTPCFSIRPNFEALKTSSKETTIRGHWSAEEHRVAAEAIASFLVSSDLLRR